MYHTVVDCEARTLGPTIRGPLSDVQSRIKARCPADHRTISHTIAFHRASHFHQVDLSQWKGVLCMPSRCKQPSDVQHGPYLPTHYAKDTL